MRIRLTVERNRLPTTSILWTVPDTTSPQAYTIARLLEDVNHILPLEAEHWGLEDYAVEVGGFECLHFSPVAQTLKEDDHVSIRPLLTAEVRSRTLTGRYQISDGGQHLIDGVPFGRPYLRQPTRPTVRIPPRKRRRLLDDFETGEQLDVARLITSHGEQAAVNASTSTTVDTSRVSSQGGIAQSRGKPKAVHFRFSQVDQNNSSDESDEDFVPEDGSDQEDHSDENEDMSESDSHSISESESESESELSPGPSSDSDADSNSRGSSSPSDASTSSSDSDIASPKSRTDSPPDVISSRPNVEDPKHTSPILNSHVPPGQGSKQTQSRNARRTQSKRLQKLKEVGELHPDATLQDLRVYETTNSSVPQTSDAELPTTPFAKFSGKRKRLIERDEVITCANDEDPEELDRRKRELMAKVAAGRPHIGEPQNAHPEASVHETSKRQSSKVENVNGSIKSSQMPQSEEPTKPPSKRLRPDTSAISRILSRQARPTNTRVTKANHQQADDKPPEIEGISDPDFWKSRVNLSAFECWNENYELSAPPFPFKQHWDPASKQMRDNTTKKKRKNNGAKEPLHTPNATDDAVNGILNYDDAPVKEQQAEYDTVAEVDMQLLRNPQTVDHIDLPLLPDDVSALPDLSPADIKEDAVIAFRLWLIDPATVTPEISAYKTAIVEREGDSGNGAGTIRLRLADRDVPKREKKFDKNGNRVYDAVDGFFMEEEERDDSLWEGTFNELQEAKLLRAAE